jgi:hypothetical protein
VQRPKDSRQDSAENKRDLLEPELVLNKERFGVQFAKVRHQLVVERFEVARKSRALCLRLGWNDLLVSRRRPPQRWQSFKQSHEILLLLDEHTAQLDFQWSKRHRRHEATQRGPSKRSRLYPYANSMKSES